MLQCNHSARENAVLGPTKGEVDACIVPPSFGRQLADKDSEGRGLTDEYASWMPDTRAHDRANPWEVSSRREPGAEITSMKISLFSWLRLRAPREWPMVKWAA